MLFYMEYRECVCDSAVDYVSVFFIRLKNKKKPFSRYMNLKQLDMD